VLSHVAPIYSYQLVTNSLSLEFLPNISK
jgi:hypothetical protein